MSKDKNYIKHDYDLIMIRNVKDIGENINLYTSKLVLYLELQTIRSLAGQREIPFRFVRCVSDLECK